MKITPLYSICIDEDPEKIINAGEEIKVKADSDEYDFSEYLENGFVKGVFNGCDDEGIWVLVGTEDAGNIYFYFDEIEELEKL
jgi:hypothetical protein